MAFRYLALHRNAMICQTKTTVSTPHSINTAINNTPPSGRNCIARKPSSAIPTGVNQTKRRTDSSVPAFQIREKRYCIIRPVSVPAEPCHFFILRYPIYAVHTRYSSTMIKHTPVIWLPSHSIKERALQRARSFVLSPISGPARAARPGVPGRSGRSFCAGGHIRSAGTRSGR